MTPAAPQKVEIAGKEFPRLGSLSEAEFAADHEYVIEKFLKFVKNLISRLFRKNCVITQKCIFGVGKCG